MKISEVLHLAADKYLCTGRKSYNPYKPSYSCIAIENACIDYKVPSGKIQKGLRNMGLNTDSACAFNEFKSGKERQAARYSWLKFAAMIAEEQGV